MADDKLYPSGIEVPRGKGVGSPIWVDLQPIVLAEQRMAEVAMVTPAKAPELLYTFNKAWKDLNEIVAKVKAEKTYAEVELSRVRGELILDVIPGVLKEKGLIRAGNPAGSEDLRQAVLDTNATYLGAQDRVNQITTFHDILNGKLTSFRMAYESTKKILGESHGMINNANPYLGGGIDDGPPVHSTSDSIMPGYGRGKYGSR